jgi:hypothetical protein
MFKTYGSKTHTYGGAHHVWKRVNEKFTSGGSLGFLPAVGEKLPVGTPIAISKMGGTAYPLYFAIASKDADATDTALFIDAGIDYELPLVGDKISTLSGQELTISAVGDVTAGEVELTVSALTADIKIGDVFYLSERDGKSINIVDLKGLTGNDVFMQEGDTYATVDIVVDGTVFEDRASFVPVEVRKYMPKILFEKEF